MAGFTEHALHGRFLRGLDRAPDGIAVRTTDTTISYRELHATALRWAGALTAATPGPDRAVGVLAKKGQAAYAGTLAALYAGATVVPLDPDFPPARLRGMIAAAGVTSLVVDEAGHAALPALLDGAPAGLPVLDPTGPPAAGARPIDPAAATPLARPAEVAPDAVAYVLFTSGSTGTPKGVTVSHANFRHYFDLVDQRYQLGPDDALSQTFDLNFDCGVFDVFTAWGAGARLVAVTPRAYVDLPAFLREHGITVWFATPSSITLVRRMGGLTPGALPGLRLSLFAGEALRCADTADWQAAAPHSAVENLYGPTELTVTIAAYRWAGRDTEAHAVHGVVPIGPVHPGHRTLLLDEAGRPVPPADTPREGELCVSGPQVSPGYLDPAQNAGRFLDHAGHRWYRTGDRVRELGGGQLAYLGRADSQVQIHGQRVELAEVEHALNAADQVTEVAAVDVGTERGTELMVFYAGTASRPALLAHARRALPPGLVPRFLQPVTELPLNSNRKIDRGQLRRRAAELVAPSAPQPPPAAPPARPGPQPHPAPELGVG
ncbi:amino acid adenylation domain-containing protein [Streptomyces sp. DSM 44915]|uniref:Amino acid adenylation domain-containing protein n=1 Tax=Streptomyces chisholmiae TaxID=3075540 RepID=A0ABU2JWY7_9ACTN|nr:amino acid adenylation domain-containing protein [Streptomyces sp. DSM 44915]MDT0269263.1 amino acid adenylation domain-containing protein [Streptomyces sp. DSM 44915]